jgi:hypothetical protein
MLNALAYLGYGVTEPDIASAAPSFCFENEGFPFIGSRNRAMRELFLGAARIPYGVELPKGPDGGWPAIAALLERGLPVLLRVDMRWLSYLYGGKAGPSYMSFGGHWVCLYGLDLDAGEALVTDTERGGPCRVALRDLEKARFSKTKTYPPRGEYAWIEGRPELWRLDPDALAESALRAVLAAYEGREEAAAKGAGYGPSEGGGEASRGPAPLTGLAGIAAFPEALASLHTALSPYAIGAAYSYMAGTIERNGTGGSAFRRLFRDFLAARAADCASPTLRESCAGLVPKAQAAAAAWSALAAAFDGAAARVGAAKGGAARDAAVAASEAETAERARELGAAEAALRDAIAAAVGRVAPAKLKTIIRQSVGR